MSEVPKMSVVIPVFGCKEYINDCIDSILAQNYSNFEIIAIFDGESIDDYGCRGYLSNDKVIFREIMKSGVSESRNVGVSLATGKYIYFLDGDDLLNGTDALETMVNYMEENSLDVLNFDADLFIHGEPGSKIAYNRYSRSIPVSAAIDGKLMLNVMLNQGQFRCPVWLLCINRSYYASKGLNFYKGIIHEDELFTYCCLIQASRTMWVPNKISRHRIRKDSIMSSPLSHMNVDGYVRDCVEIIKYNQKHSIGHVYGDKYLLRMYKLVAEKSKLLSFHECSLVEPLDDDSFEIFMSYDNKKVLDSVDCKVLNSIFPDKTGALRLSTDRPSVSVIMPVYNASSYLQESVMDVISQTISSIELICIDDGSTDNSLEILN